MYADHKDFDTAKSPIQDDYNALLIQWSHDPKLNKKQVLMKLQFTSQANLKKSNSNKSLHIIAL